MGLVPWRTNASPAPQEDSSLAFAAVSRPPPCEPYDMRPTVCGRAGVVVQSTVAQTA